MTAIAVPSTINCHEISFYPSVVITTYFGFNNEMCFLVCVKRVAIVFVVQNDQDHTILKKKYFFVCVRNSYLLWEAHSLRIQVFGNNVPEKMLSHKKAEVNQQFRVFTKQEVVCFIQNFDEEPLGKSNCI
jgi:hypothetical protein